jgi:hypothetical protein
LPLKIFISSKLQNLQTERDLAERVIEEHRFEPIRCENWGASSTHTEETCRRRVRASDIVVFILGQQYSSMVTREYNEAGKWKKPCLVFVKSTGNRDPSLKRLITKMKNHVVLKEYTTLRMLRKVLNLSISDLIETRFKSEKEKAIIDQAFQQCIQMNEKILKARKQVQSTRGFKAVNLSSIKQELLSEKLKIEKILKGRQ